MESTDRRVRSEIGMSQEEALVMLQHHASDNDMLITGFNRLGNRWIATLRPLAEFPPSADNDGGDGEDDSRPAGEDDGAGESAPPKPKSDSEGNESGPPKEKKEEGSKGDLPAPDKHPGSENSEEHAIMGLLKQIAEQLGVNTGPEPKMAPGTGPDVPPPPGPPKPPVGPTGPGPGGPAGGSPGAGPKGQPYGTKLKPGEVPNRPGVVPVGAPSFASTKTAVSDFSWSPQPATTTPTTSVPPNVGESGNPAIGGMTPCSKCGQPTMGGVCANCVQAAGGAGGTGGAAPGMGMQPQANIDGSFFVRSSVAMTPKEAHSELNAAYNPQGFKVSKIYPAHEDGTLTILVAPRA